MKKDQQTACSKVRKRNFSIQDLYIRKYKLLLFFIVVCISADAASPLKPDRLTCEYIENPLGICEQQPRLTWTLFSTERNQQQAAYEIVVSDNMLEINKGRGTIWDSEKVAAAQNTNIQYAGKPLQPFTRYYWRVRVWNKQDSVSDWSAPAFFETAMLQPSDWKGKWIGEGREQ